MAFNPHVFDAEAFTVFTAKTALLTSSPEYTKLLKCIVEIYDPSGTTLLIRYDSFNPNSNPIVCLDCEIVLGLTSTSFFLRFEDGGKVINHNEVGLGNKILVYAGRYSNDVTLLFTGYAEDREINILGNNVMEFTMSGAGEMASFNDIIINFKRASSSLTDIEDPNFPRRPDADMAVNELVLDVLSDPDIRITRDIVLKDYFQLDISGISPVVKESLLSVVQHMTEASQVLNFLCEVTGAFWKIENGRFIFAYPETQHSGIILKNKVSSTDLAESTSYFDGSWKYKDSISKENGFANRIYVSTNIDTKSVASVMSNKGSTTLFNRAIAQQFTTNESRISTLAFIMSRVGDPFTASEGALSTDVTQQIIKGEIRNDDGNNQPLGSTIATFEIQAGGLTSSPDTIFVNDIKVDAANLSPNGKYWIVLFPIGTGLRNTIRWHHNGDLSTPDQYSSFAIGESKTSLGDFRTARFGPTFTYAVFAKIRSTQEYSDPQSIDRFRLKEDKIDLDFLDDPLSIAKMMQNVLAIRGKPVRKYNLNQVTLPLGLWFTPGQQITIVDDTGHHEEGRNVYAEVHEVRYNWGTDSGSDKVLGLFTVSILPVGVLNWHSDLFPPGD